LDLGTKEENMKTQMQGLKCRLFTCAVLLSLIGCSSVSHSSDTKKSATVEETPKPAADVKVDSRLVSANTRFGLKLYKEILKQGADRNVFVSGASVGLALAMAYNGAEGGTRQAMARALELQGISLDELNRANAALKASLENPDPKVQLQIANSMWAKIGVEFKPDFMSRNKQFYGAEVSTLDFGSPSAPAKINDWVKQKTAGKIEKIIDQIDGDSILFLINAIYFNGKWSDAFDKAKTKEESFTVGSGRQKRHPMMPQSGKYNYYEGEKFQAVSLPYGGKRVSMYIFLPAPNSSLSEFHALLSSENWDSWMTRFSQTDGDISVPRFRVEYELELGEALKALGMAQAFDANSADFSGMVEAQRAFIGKVKHKTFAEVNEEGTEAAAVTSVEMVATSMAGPRRRFRMVVDRPFFCAIRDNQTGTVLFMGSIVDPM
jgi:serine protease inhibitor